MLMFWFARDDVIDVVIPTRQTRRLYTYQVFVHCSTMSTGSSILVHTCSMYVLEILEATAVGIPD